MTNPNRHKQGVALVTTVIMLSIVTIMTVAFLGVTRRERASVIASTDLTISRQMSKMGSERAVGEVVSRMIRDNSIQSIDFLVSTNYYNPEGFEPGLATAGNVNYFFREGGGNLSQVDALQNIANLQIDPRPPVFFQNIVNRRPTNEFRFFLDINRNGAFEDTGVVPLVEGGQFNDRFELLSGDPQWIGVLENPDMPHSSTNRFIGRYLFYALPTGRSLDLNYIHNQSKMARVMGDASMEGYFRNQGVGAWEINLAAFLRQLNPNIWDYNYNTNLASSSFGRAFADAHDLTLYKYFRVNESNPGNSFFGYQSLLTPLDFFALSGNRPGVLDAFRSDGVDNYGDSLGLSVSGDDEDEPVARRWAGSGPPRQYFDPQELFSSGRPYSLTSTDSPRGGFAFRMTASMTNLVNNDTVNRYTFYKMLSQMGVDSLPAHRNRLNLNYDNRSELVDPVTIPRGDTRFKTSEFLPWDPRIQFIELANLMLKERFKDIDSNIAINNLPVYPNNIYGAELHQVLQMCANVVDANHHGTFTETRQTRTPNGDIFTFPMVFKPVFTTGASNAVTITDWELLGENGFRAVTDQPWYDLSNTSDLTKLTATPVSRGNIYGVPYVVAARKGVPAFNEVLFETHATVTRKIRANKRSPFDTFDKPKLIEQLHYLSISNNVGYEVWNPYRDSYPFPVTMIATNALGVGLFNETGLLRSRLYRGDTQEKVPASGFAPATASTFTSTANPDPSFRLALNGNYLVTTNELYVNGVFPQTGEVSFGRDLTPLQMNIAVTNRVTYLMYDDNTGHILDFVNLQPLTNFYRLSEQLTSQGTSQSGNQGEGVFWQTNNVNSPMSVQNLSSGHLNQILASLGDIDVDWNSFSQDPIIGQDKNKAITTFEEFMGQPVFPPTVPRTTLSMQAPFSPTRKFVWRNILQANDPMVHYTLGDLNDVTQPGTEPIAIPLSFIGSSTLTNNNLLKLNTRFRPWGGNPAKSASSSVANQQSNPAIKDPAVSESSLFDLVENNRTLGHKYATLGSLGAVHRGTPWQTIYMKSEGVGADKVTPNEWRDWSGHENFQITHPTNDWSMFSLFTTAFTDNATRGLLSVNQTNSAAWAAVLGGVKLKSSEEEVIEDVVITPVTPAMDTLIAGINQGRQVFPPLQQGGQNLYPFQGGLLAAPELSIASPFLGSGTVSDAVMEAIPRKIMSLVKDDDPRVVIYAYGQALRPADRSVVGRADQFNGLVTNYIPTSEFVTKTLIEFITDQNGTLSYRTADFSIVNPSE